MDDGKILRIEREFTQMMTQAGLCHVTVTSDLDGRDRVVSAQLAGFTPERRG